MKRALELAAKGKGSVNPNPCVGCVIVKNGRTISEGYHHHFGGPHAEVEALSKAGARARGATLYVTLEPCTHVGKTPPCAPLVIESGVKRVVIAMKDPNPKVAGRGLSALRRAGIDVTVGVREKEARELNRAFLTWMTKKRPYVILKMAMTLDGKIATPAGESKWISSFESRRLVHRLRCESDAVLIGARTARLDNPTLSSHGRGRDPLRLVLDPKKRLSSSLKLFRDKKTPALRVSGPVKNLLTALGRNQISQLLVEGGGETAWQFVQGGFVDEVYFFVAPKILGGRTAPTAVEGKGYSKLARAFSFATLTAQKIGPDVLLHGVRSF